MNVTLLKKIRKTVEYKVVKFDEQCTWLGNINHIKVLSLDNSWKWKIYDNDMMSINGISDPVLVFVWVWRSRFNPFNSKLTYIIRRKQSKKIALKNRKQFNYKH